VLVVGLLLHALHKGSPLLKGVHHAVHHLVQKQRGSLRINGRAELKVDVKMQPCC
jgi:hypothetical protein